MLPHTLIASLLASQSRTPKKTEGQAFAPSNIALVKYWGKRDAQLNLPATSSLSISLGQKGARTSIIPIEGKTHRVSLNEESLLSRTPFYDRLASFIRLITPDPHQAYAIRTDMNLPVAAGLASSACGFAALTLAFSDLYAWDLPAPILSILCRMGSGSACRSLWQGFVEWHRGERSDGLDSFAEPLSDVFPELRIGLCMLSTAQKPLSSREGMNRTTQTSTLYESWPKQVEEDLIQMKHALATQDFPLLGATAEHNAMAMHATMLSARPPVCYWLPETLQAMRQVWSLREQGVPVYFTEDAGPNLKLLTLSTAVPMIEAVMPSVEWIQPFAAS